MYTKIEWADYSWSPVTGCSHVSAGCDNCYARRMANRLRGRYGYPQDDPFKVTLHPERLDEFVEPPKNHPYRWRKPRMIFVCSMGDLFHKNVPFNFIERVWATMMEANHHIYIILTKRPERMLEAAKYFCWTAVPHIWFGVSVEDQKTADERIPELLKIDAAVRIVSIEPMLGAVDLKGEWGAYENGNNSPLRKIWLDGISWIIVGGETSWGARRMEPAWAMDVWRQCVSASVPYFFKQEGNLLAKDYNPRPGGWRAMVATRQYPMASDK